MVYALNITLQGAPTLTDGYALSYSSLGVGKILRPIGLDQQDSCYPYSSYLGGYPFIRMCSHCSQYFWSFLEIPFKEYTFVSPK